MAEKELWLVDTDCGVDDAQALVLALSHTESLNYDIVAITTTVGNTVVDHVDKNVAEVLRICGREDIPIHRGATHPIIRDRNELFGAAEIHGNDGMNGYWGREFGDKPEPTLKKVEVMPAALAIPHYVKLYGGRLNVITIGPLTNLATAVLADSSFVP
jgi:purine nucleosidase